MSKEQQPSSAPDAASSAAPDPRWFLPDFLTATSGTGLRPTVTLNVGGLLVAGELIDAQTYFDELTAVTNEELKDAISAQALKQLTDLFGAYGNRAGHPDPEGPGPHEPTHIHLRRARVYQPGGTPAPAAGGVSWRVRLDAVDGFTLDLLEPR